MFTKGQLTPKRLDLAEKYLLSAIFLVFSYRMVAAYMVDGHVVNLLYVIDQFVITAFVVCRRPTEAITLRPGDWFAGLAGTFLPMAIGPVSDQPLVPLGIAATLLICGFATHFAAKLTLRRSFGVVPANRGIRASGPYRFVRHPMYTGYMMVQSALLLAGPTFQNVVIVAICWSLQLWRIAAEERLLQDDKSYRDLMLGTRYRLMPGIY